MVSKLCFLIVAFKIFLFVFGVLKFHYKVTKYGFIFIYSVQDSSFFNLKIHVFLQGHAEKKKKKKMLHNHQSGKNKKKKSSIGKDVGKILVSYWWEFINYYDTFGLQSGDTSKAENCITCDQAIMILGTHPRENLNS